MSSATADKPMPSLNKLPRWAREEIIRLRSDLEIVRRDLAMALGGSKTRVEVEPHRDGERCYLNPNAAVRFWIGPRIDDYIDVSLLKHHGGAHCVHLMGISPIAVEPSASNVAHVRLQER